MALTLCLVSAKIVSEGVKKEDMVATLRRSFLLNMLGVLT